MMKNTTLFAFIIGLFILLIGAGCSPTDTPPTATQAPLATNTKVADSPLNTPTEEVLPTEIPQPSPTPEPIPCTIAFESDRDGNSEIYRMDPDGNNLINLTNHPARDLQADISADGSRVAFISDRESETCEGQAVYVMDADGGNVKQLSYCIWANEPDWSYDGQWIVFSADGDIFIVPSDGSTAPVNLTNSPEEDSFPIVSPDNQKIAFLSGGSHQWNIFIMDLDGSQMQQLTTKGGEIGINWSEDGRIVVVGWDRGDQGCCNFVMNQDGSDIMVAGGKGEMQKYLPFWTLDGNRVECASVDLQGGNEEIYLVGEIYPDIFLNLTNNPANDRAPSWPAYCGPVGYTQENTESQEKRPEEEVQVQSTVNPQDIVLGYAGDDPWQSQRKDNFFKACQELGIQCVQGELNELINQEVSAIVLNSRNQVINGAHDSILGARDKGIPVVVLDAEAVTHGAYYITINHAEWADKGIQWMFEGMEGQGDFVFFNFKTYNNYKKVIGDNLDKFPGIKLVENHFDDYTHDYKIMEADVRSLTEKFPNLKGVWTDEEFANVIWGLKGAVPADDWPMVLCEASKKGLQIWETVLQDNPGFDCIALGNPPGIAYDAAYTAYYLASGKEINTEALGGEFGTTLYVDFPVITRDNFSEILHKLATENDDYQVDQLMSPDEILENWFLP